MCGGFSITYKTLNIVPALAAFSQGAVLTHPSSLFNFSWVWGLKNGTAQDYLVMDRGLTPKLSAQYGGLEQLPLAGQAQVMVYNISALNSTDPNIVRPAPSISPHP
jgi:hypothetical protein